MHITRPRRGVFSIPSREGKRKRVPPLFGCWRTRFLFVPRSPLYTIPSREGCRGAAGWVSSGRRSRHPPRPFGPPLRGGDFFSISPLGRGAAERRGGSDGRSPQAPTPAFGHPSKEGIGKGSRTAQVNRGSFPPGSASCPPVSFPLLGAQASCLPVFTFAGWKPALPGGKSASKPPCRGGQTRL